MVVLDSVDAPSPSNKARKNEHEPEAYTSPAAIGKKLDLFSGFKLDRVENQSVLG